MASNPKKQIRHPGQALFVFPKCKTPQCESPVPGVYVRFRLLSAPQRRTKLQENINEEYTPASRCLSQHAWRVLNADVEWSADVTSWL